jgi:FtsK/SpoIIIE family
MTRTRGYQIRRHARWMRRYGLQPMIFMNSGDQLPEAIALVILHWAWRYRSELAPLTTALALALVGWVLHATYSHTWPQLAAVTTMAAAALGAAGPRVGLISRTERVYAATVVLAAGWWLAAATAAGPWHPLLLRLLAGAGLVLALPWWAHRRRRARVRVERILTDWPDIAQTIGLPGSRVLSAVVDMWGWRARFALARGQTITEVIAKIASIESGLGTFRGSVRIAPTPDGLANRFELRVLSKDPHADAITWPGPSVSSITQPIDFGPFEDATPATVLLLRRHALFGGATGSGKSSGLNVLMGNLAACTDVVIWAIDLKRGMELGPWTACIARLARTPTEARALLADAAAVLEARATYLAATGQRVWEPTSQMPALVIIVDEYAELVDHAPSATGDADSIGRRGRAVAVTLIAATQRPHPEGDGPGRAALDDGRAGLLPRPRAQRHRPNPRPGHARRRLAPPHPQCPRQVSSLRTRTRHPPPCPRLPAHRPGRPDDRQPLQPNPTASGRNLPTRPRRPRSGPTCRVPQRGPRPARPRPSTR